MKRSEINQAVRSMERLCAAHGVSLPPFCQFSPEQWQALGPEYDEIRCCRLGWDITDYGLGRFDETGFALITLRNGIPGDPRYPKGYAEKLLFLKEGQYSPMHFHWNKMEDIINRGGGELLITLYNADEAEGLADSPVQFSRDGVRQELRAGGQVSLRPGESITLTPGLYHDFSVKAGSGDVLIGEVSLVNDDERDNRFLEELGRFPSIEEDEAPYRLLCTEYPKSRQGEIDPGERSLEQQP